MRISTVVSSIVGLALVLGLATPAAAQGGGALVGAGVSFLHIEEETGTGFFFDVAKTIKKMNKIDIGGVGDFAWQGFDGASAFSFMGGVRFTGTGNPKFSPFGQFLLGGTHVSFDECDGEGCSETPFTISFGGGVDVRLTDKVNFRGQIDFPIIMFEGDSSTGQRYSFGISLPVGK